MTSLLFAVVLGALGVSWAADGDRAAGSGLTTFRVMITNTTPLDRGLTAGAYLVHDEQHTFWQAGGRADGRAGGAAA